MKSGILALVLGFSGLVPGGALAAGDAATAGDPTPPGSVVTPTSKIDPRLWFVTGPVDVVVRLEAAPLGIAVGKDAKHRGSALSKGQQKAYVQKILDEQEPVVALVGAAGGQVMGRLYLAMNAVLARVDASDLRGLAQVGTVTAIRPVVDYDLDLTTTVPYIGAAAMQTAGLDGTGVRVAVIDSGIDYTHANLGGPGTLADYAAAYGNPVLDSKHATTDGLFPTAKVVGGYDYVGEYWPNPEPEWGEIVLQPDPDPIDAYGHGTHVADILAGSSVDGTHKGVAPGVLLYAFKACSAVSSSCSGYALLSAIEACLNPAVPTAVHPWAHPDYWVIGDNPVDVVNLSLGRPYGMQEMSLQEAVQTVTEFGLVVVCSAGNEGDKPYVVGAPSTAPGAISVAQTAMPNEKGARVQGKDADGKSYTQLNTAVMSWAPLNSTVSGQVVVVEDLDGDEFYDPGCDPISGVAGKIALIDRGTCAVSLKVHNAASAGAIGVLIGLTADGDAISFAENGGTARVPTVCITQAEADFLKASIAKGTTTAWLIPISLAGSMVSTSSRGPGYSAQSIKPDLAAPGASQSAVVGTGTGESGFGGTSGAAPMVAGSAALLVGADPSMPLEEVRARLMNTAYSSVRNPGPMGSLTLAPFTRMGAGEVRVDRAWATTMTAVDQATRLPSLSLGYAALSRAGMPHVFRRTVEVQNHGSAAAVYRLTGTHRYAASSSVGSLPVTLSCEPASLSVSAGGVGTFDFVIQVDPTKLPDWNLDGGAYGGDGERLRLLEQSGQVVISSPRESIRVPWHLLPHKAAELNVANTNVYVGSVSGVFPVRNPLGAKTGVAEVFDLLAVGPTLPPLPPRDPILDPQYLDLYRPDLKSLGARLFSIGGGDYALQFAVTTYDERPHPNAPAQFEVWVDTTGDNSADFYIYSSELNFTPGGTGQNVTYVTKVGTDVHTAYFHSDTDLKSSAVILTVPWSVLEVPVGTQLRVMVAAYDTYLSGRLMDVMDANGTDWDAWIEGAPYVWCQYTPGFPRYSPSALELLVSPDASVNVNVTRVPGGATASPSQKGFLMVYRDAKPGQWSQDLFCRSSSSLPR